MQARNCIPITFLSVDAKTEEKIAIQAIRLNTLSKLTFADSKRFDALVRDVFPGAEFQDVDYAELQSALVETTQEMGLIVSKVQVSFQRGIFEWS